MSRRDRGDATAQVVILTPLLILLILLGVQTALFFHAANVASAAASQGAAAGSPPGAGAGDAVAAARQTLTDLGISSPNPPVAHDNGAFISVTVEVDVVQLIPFFPDSVRRSANEPKERFVPESDR